MKQLGMKARLPLLIRFMVIAMCLPALATASPSEEFNAFIAQTLAKQTFVISPSSLHVVLNASKDASRGETARQIASITGSDPQTRPENVPKAEETSVTGIWVARQYQTSKAFRALFRRKYGGDVASVDFDNGDGQRVINDWIARLSANDLHGFSLPYGTDAVVANVSTFHGVWKHPFDPRLTMMSSFNGVNGPEPIPLMSRLDTFGYRDDSIGETVALDYVNGYRMLLFLPKHSTPELLSDLLALGVNRALALEEMIVFVPRLHLRIQTNFATILPKAGVTRAFSQEADFSPLFGAAGHPISAMIQEVDLRVDEQGTVAKALTESGHVEGLVKHRIIRFDRPFAFALLRMDSHPTILYEGQVLDVK